MEIREKEHGKIDSDLWNMFVICGNGTQNCHKCRFTNQRTDGYCCSLMDNISKKLEENKNGIRNSVFAD